jgi:hypothetical protein
MQISEIVAETMASRGPINPLVAPAILAAKIATAQALADEAAVTATTSQVL